MELDLLGSRENMKWSMFALPGHSTMGLDKLESLFGLQARVMVMVMVMVRVWVRVRVRVRVRM